MNDREKAYEHRASVTGSSDDRNDPALEHQDTASGHTTGRNEIDARRGEPDSHGPSPRDDTRIDRTGE